MHNSKNITYVSNAGVLINIDDKKILIDGLCNSKVPMYKNTPVEIGEKLIKGVSPFDNIDIILVTHNHSDHFDANLVASFLSQNPNTVIVSNSSVISHIKNCSFSINTDNLIKLEPDLNCSESIKVKDVDILAISMLHEGKDMEDINNLAFLIDYGTRVLHLGDAAPVKENFEMLVFKEKKIDLLIANFPYVCIPRARKMIKNYINTEKVFVVHLPHKRLDEFNLIDRTKRSYNRSKDKFIHTTFLEDIGQTVNIK